MGSILIVVFIVLILVFLIFFIIGNVGKNNKDITTSLPINNTGNEKDKENIANDESVLHILITEIRETRKSVSKIHFWIMLWSILSLCGIIIYLFVFLSNL